MRKTILLSLTLLTGSFTLSTQAALKVFACEPEWAALAKELGGRDVEVYAATTAHQDVHKIQARPSLIAQYRQADLVVCTGAELEIGWLPALEEKGNSPRVRPGTPGFFEASRHVTMRDIPASVDRAQGDVHAFGNPHIQTGPQNIAPVAAALVQRLAEVDAARAASYRQRYEEFHRRWSAAMEQWRERALPLKGHAVVSHHKTWVYLYDWLGIQELATLEPRPGIPPSGAHLKDVLTLLKVRPAKMVVYSAYEDPQAAEWLSQRAHIPAVQLPFSVGGAPGADDLFGLYEVTLHRLLAALNGMKSQRDQQ